MILTITMHANKLVQADQCTVYLLDEQKNQLWSVAAAGGGKDMRIPADVGTVSSSVSQQIGSGFSSNFGNISFEGPATTESHVCLRTVSCELFSEI